MKEFEALLKRKREEDNKARFNTAIVAAAVYNTAPFGDPNRKRVNPLDFVPDWKETDPNDLSHMTAMEQKAYLHSLFFKRG